MEVSIDEFSMDLDGQALHFDHSAIKTVKKLQWPGQRRAGEVRLRVSPAITGGTAGITVNGPWAWFRLFRSIQNETT